MAKSPREPITATPAVPAAPAAPEAAAPAAPAATVKPRIVAGTGNVAPRPHTASGGPTRGPLVTGDQRFRVGPHKGRARVSPNTPVDSEQSLAMRAAADEAAQKQAAARAAKGGARSKKWVKLGLQPGERGFTLHIEFYEGDKMIKQTVQTGLSPMGARERLALHMSSLWAGF